MRVTAEELSLLRSRPQRTKLNLSVFRPTTILKCRVNNASIKRNARTIAFDTVTAGSWTAVEAGMTLLVGTTEGGRELGKVRIRSVTSSQFVVAENSYIEWKDKLYLTVLRYWEVWPVYPRIIQDPSNPETTLWYKDYDIPYSNQNTVLGAFPCAGPHRATFLDTATGTASIYYTATGTHHVADTAFSTHWWFEGGTPTGSTAYTPGLIEYGTAGQYTTRLTVTGTNFVDSTYRYVSVYDKPENGTNTPILKWEISKIEGSRAGGGYTATIRILENIQVYEGDVIVLFGESWFGNNKQTIGGNASGNSDIFFVGHILQGSIQYNYKYGEVIFTVGSISEFLKEQEGFSVSVESVASPSDWYQLYDMDIEKALYHYLKWHTTVLSVNDVQWIGDDRPIQYFDSDRESIYDATNSLVRGAMFGYTVSDMQGKLWQEPSAQAFPLVVSGTYSVPLMELQKGDWINTPRIEEQFIPSISYLEYGGIAYSGVVTGTFAPFMADAPGNAPLYRGKAERTQGLALKSQREINQIVGNQFANKNYQYPSLTYSLVSSFRNLDIAPQESVVLLVDSTDTPRGTMVSGTFLPNNIGWTYDAKNQLFYPDTISFFPLITGAAGQTIPIPETPDDGGYIQPPRVSPPIPAFDYPPLIYNAMQSDYVEYEFDQVGMDDNTGVYISNIISSRNNPVTTVDAGGYTAFKFKTSGLYQIYASCVLVDNNYDYQVNADFPHANYTDNHIEALSVRDEQTTDVSYLNMSGTIYIKDATKFYYLWFTSQGSSATTFNVSGSRLVIIRQ